MFDLFFLFLYLYLKLKENCCLNLGLPNDKTWVLKIGFKFGLPSFKTGQKVWFQVWLPGFKTGQKVWFQVWLPGFKTGAQT